MGVLAFVCPATGKSVLTDLEIDQNIYSSILKNRLSHMHCSQCGERHELSEVVTWLAEDSGTLPPDSA
jgi:hypothetical protein